MPKRNRSYMGGEMVLIIRQVGGDSCKKNGIICVKIRKHDEKKEKIWMCNKRKENRIFDHVNLVEYIS